MSQTKEKSGVSRRRFLADAGASVGAAAIASCQTMKERSSEGLTIEDRSRIVRAAIHPAIGVARIGNSVDPDGYFIGPEVVDPPLTMSGQSRDRTGALKRQAARFRIYGYDADGRVVGELTTKDAKINWKAELANKKAQWYRFIAALDLPEAATLKCLRRNSKVAGAARKGLAILPGARQISGRLQGGKKFSFAGTFMNIPVTLGELRTDEVGRLLVLGGLGKSGSPNNLPVYDANDPDTFNNADGWYDDIADGPVEAGVTVDGRSIEVDSAWVIVGPPNYAPDVIGWRTLHDLLMDSFIEKGWLETPKQTSFSKDVLPVLRRLSNLQWVNNGFAKEFAKGRDFDFENRNLIAQLARPRPTDGGEDSGRSLRQKIYEQFRHPHLDSIDRKRWPWIYGDAFGTFDKSMSGDLVVSKIRSMHLQRWAQGQFVADWQVDTAVLDTLDKVPVVDQPEMLDRSALHFCLADAFHPGCEVTWPMRWTTMFQKPHAVSSGVYPRPFRILRRTSAQLEADYGDQLTQQNCLAKDGPLYRQGPGDLTRWMAVPWQGDTIFCRSGYEPEYDPYLPTFWPARVPNHVLTEADYSLVMQTNLPIEQRAEAFERRQSWVRRMKGGAPDQIKQMVSEFAQIGVIEARPGIADNERFPSHIFVESLPPSEMKSFGQSPTAASPEGATRGLEKPKSAVDEAGWESVEQLMEFRSLRARNLNRR